VGTYEGQQYSVMVFDMVVSIAAMYPLGHTAGLYVNVHPPAFVGSGRHSESCDLMSSFAPE